MPFEARAARINRRGLRTKLDELAGARAELARRDLNDEARQEEDKKLVKEARREYNELVANVKGLEAAAVRHLEGLTPAAQRRKAVFGNPTRFAALVQALEHLPDEELPAMAELASEEGDLVAFAALSRVVVERDPGSEIASQVMRRAEQASEGFAEAIAEVVVARYELAGMAHNAADALKDETLARSALTLAHEATSLELEGRTFTYGDGEVDALYKGLRMDRALEPVSWPKAEGGTIDPSAFQHQKTA